MGALPKKKPSKTRARHRHSAWMKRQADLIVTEFVVCGQCGSEIFPHRVCSECGYYKGEQVIEPKTQVRRVNS